MWQGAGTGNGDLRGAGRKQLCLGHGMGLGGMAGSSQVEGTGNKADRASLRWQNGTSWLQPWKCEDGYDWV